MTTLDSFVDQDYTIVYFHYGLTNTNKPPIRWLLQVYRALDRKYKKNLKALYLVHPTKFIRIIWNVFKPFISAKFERKLKYVNHLHELRDLFHTDQLGVPTEVLEHDRKLLRMAQALSVQRLHSETDAPPLDTQQFGVYLKHVLDHNPGSGVPPIVEKVVVFLQQNGLSEEGLFRRSVSMLDITSAKKRINIGETIDFSTESYGIHLAAVLLKSFLRELKEPIMTFHLFDVIMQVQNFPQDRRAANVKKIVDQLPAENKFILDYIVKFLTQVEEKSTANLMTATNLAVVFGPNLAWSATSLPSLAQLNNLNTFTYHLISNYRTVFD